MPHYRLLTLAKPKASGKALADTFRTVARVVYRERGQFRTIENLGIRPLATPVTRSTVRYTDARFVTCSFDVGPKGRAEVEQNLKLSSDFLSWEMSRPNDELAKFKVHRREKLKRFSEAMKLRWDEFDPENPQ